MKYGMRIQKNFFLIQVVRTKAISLKIENKKIWNVLILVTDLSYGQTPRRLYFSYVHPSVTHTNGPVWWTEKSSVTGDVQTHLSGTCKTPCELYKPLEKGIFKNQYLHRFTLVN